MSLGESFATEAKLSIDTVAGHNNSGRNLLGSAKSGGGKEDSVQCVHCLRRIARSDYSDHNKTCELRLELCRCVHSLVML